MSVTDLMYVVMGWFWTLLWDHRKKLCVRCTICHWTTGTAKKFNSFVHTPRDSTYWPKKYYKVLSKETENM